MVELILSREPMRLNGWQRIGIVASVIWAIGVPIYMDSAAERDAWPAPGSEDTELGVLMEPEVGHGETEVYARVQA
jgi:hypothetical protein